MSAVEFGGFVLVLPDLSRLWIHDCPQLEHYTVNSLLRDISAEIERDSQNMSVRLEHLVADLEQHLPNDKYWRERAID